MKPVALRTRVPRAMPGLGGRRVLDSRRGAKSPRICHTNWRSIGKLRVNGSYL